MEPHQSAGSPISHAAHNSAAAGNAGHGGETTLRDRILLHPDVYVGSVEKRTRTLWVHDGRGYMAQREVTYVPALLKVFDEVLLHAADTKRSDPAAMDTLRVDVDAARGSISVYSSGAGGVPIAVHADKPVYVPETFFAQLVINTPDDVDGNEVANANHGVKLSNVFSTEFVVEIADGPGRRRYKQVFSDNMGKASCPEVTGYNKKVSWTKVTFKPDLARFSMTRLDDDDTVTLMRKRTFDMTGVLGATVQVVFNGKTMLVPRGWPGYVYRYIQPRSGSKDWHDELPWICETVSDRWEVGVSLTVDGEGFEQVSFVNNVATVAGGTHVDYVANKIVANVLTFVKDKFERVCTEDDVKKHLVVFVNLRMENPPTFDSPAREALTTPPEEFGSECELSDLFYKRVRAGRLLARLLARRPYRLPDARSIGNKRRRKTMQR